MEEFATDPLEGHDSRIEKRDIRALTEYMTTIPLDGEMYSVTTESGSEYRVDAREGRCNCPDARHNLADDERCKHERRVRFATGDMPIPAWVDVGTVDPQLGEHVEDSPVFAASDGGQLLDVEDDGRPGDCDCKGWNEGSDLPCWPCYRDGHETPPESD
jgi:hypothetical protein